MYVNAISSVYTGKNFLGQNFGERKNKNHVENHSTTAVSLMKAAPLAALFAMSPLNNVDAQTLGKYTNAKEIAVMKYENAGTRGESADVYLVSTDNNDEDAEGIKLRFATPKTVTESIDGKPTTFKYEIANTVYVDTLEVIDVCEKYKNGEDRNYKRYRAIGPGVVSKSNGLTTDGTNRVVNTNAYYQRVPNYHVEISEGLYDYLTDCMGDEVAYKTVKAVVDGDKAQQRILENVMR